MKPSSGFLGTYFELDSVLRLELWTRIMAWLVLAAYVAEAAYNAFQNVYGALTGGYPVDGYFVFVTLSHVFQGGMLFIILQVAANILLILLDIEDNTRRAARETAPKS